MKKSEKFDVIVVGGGTSGVIASIASARSGAKTLLVEESTSLGGTNTKALVGPLTSFWGENEQPVVGGIPIELLDELTEMGGSLGTIKDPIGFAYSLTPVDFNMLKLLQVLKVSDEPNMTLRMREMFIDTILDNESVIGIQTINPSGEISSYYAKQIIDATGDADVVAKANAESVEYGRVQDKLTQPMSLIFSLNHVDFDKIKEDVQADRNNFVLSDDEEATANYIAISGYFNEVKKSSDKNEFPVTRDRLLFFEGTEANEIYCNTTRVNGLNSLITSEYTKAYQAAYRQVYELWQWMKKEIPAFKNSTIGQIGELGIRETRRIIGLKQLDVGDILEGKSQEKAIAVGAYPIDIHSPSGEEMEFVEEEIVKNYEIDLEMLLPKNLENIIVAGRPISATHEAHASSRVSATCMAVGQAVGVTCALASQKDCLIQELNYQEIKENIEALGGITKK